MSNKGRRSLADFDSFGSEPSPQQPNKIGVNNPDHSQSDNSRNNNSVTEQSNVIVKQVHESDSGFLQAYEEKTKRKTIEQTHTRQTYLIQNDLIKRLENLAINKGRGFKTYLVNHAINKVLEELEEEE